MENMNKRKRSSSDDENEESEEEKQDLLKKGEEMWQIPLDHFTESWQGMKNSNEDRFSSAENDFSAAFGVFDGHGGAQTADYLRQHLLKTILKASLQQPTSKLLLQEILSRNHHIKQLKKQLVLFQEQQKQLIQLIESDAEIDDEEAENTIAIMDQVVDAVTNLKKELKEDEEVISQNQTRVLEAQVEMTSLTASITQIFHKVDEDILTKKKLPDGSTALVIQFFGYNQEDIKFVTANVGDCRAVLCRRGKAVPLTQDHKPNRSDEKKRITKSGGYVAEVGGISRVCTAAGAGVNLSKKNNTYLAVSRAFGDKELKHPTKLVISTPEINLWSLQEDDLFVILACDGIWDVISNQEAVDVVMKNFGDSKSAANALVKLAYNKDSGDNLTASVIQFPWKKDIHSKILIENQKIDSKSFEVVKEDPVEEGFDMFNV